MHGYMTKWHTYTIECDSDAEAESLLVSLVRKEGILDPPQWFVDQMEANDSGAGEDAEKSTEEQARRAVAAATAETADTKQADAVVSGNYLYIHTRWELDILSLLDPDSRNRLTTTTFDGVEETAAEVALHQHTEDGVQEIDSFSGKPNFAGIDVAKELFEEYDFRYRVYAGTPPTAFPRGKIPGAFSTIEFGNGDY